MLHKLDGNIGSGSTRIHKHLLIVTVPQISQNTS